MKSITLSLVVLLMTISSGAAQNYPVPRFSYTMSPDHPSTWVDGASRMHQDLRWSDDRHMVVADVTYSTAAYADNTHPTEEDSFVLRMPDIKKDATGNLTVGGVAVGTLKEGLFGTHIVLAPNVQLSIHRHHGVIFAALIPGNSD